MAAGAADEAEQFVASLDPVPTVEGEHTRSMHRRQTRPWDLSKVDFKGEPILKPQTPLAGPNTDVGQTELGDAFTGDAVDLVKLQLWDDLNAVQKEVVALRKAKLFPGFNLP